MEHSRPNIANRIPGLDGLRGLSITMVLLSHHSQYFENFWISLGSIALPLKDGALGVNIFFAISGYLITGLAMQDHSTETRFSFRDFYIKRCCKLLPVLWAYLVVVAVLAAWLGAELKLGDFIRAATFTTGHYSLTSTAAIGHTWSLSVEEFFYISWLPTLVWAKGRRVRLNTIFGLVFLAAPLIRILNYMLGSAKWHALVSIVPIDFVPVMGSLDFIAAGCFAQVNKRKLESILNVTQSSQFTRKSLILVAATTIFLPSTGVGSLRYISIFCTFAAPTLQCVGLVALITLIANQARAGDLKLLNSRALRHVGLASYSIYVVQQIFFYPISTGPKGSFYGSIVSLPMALIAGIIVFHLVEKPMNRRLRRLLLKKRSEVPRIANLEDRSEAVRKAS